MKKFLFALLVVKILAAAFLVISLLPSSIIISIVYGILSLLEITLVVAVITNIDNIDELWYSVNRIRRDIKVINDRIEKNEDNQKSNISIDLRETARGAWDCIKCGTVNKKGSSVCEHCGASYSSWENPTVNEGQRKKISRWIK